MMARRPKPIPMLNDMKPEYGFSGGARGKFYRPGHAHRLPIANPSSEFAERVKAEHIRKASVELRRAYYFATEFAGAKHRQVVADVTSHATVAGEYAAYSGRQLEEWHREFAKEFSIPTIIDAFDEKFNATIELLTTPDEELEDEPTENPGRWPRSQVQSLLFDVDRWSEPEAKRWAHEHGFKYGDVDTTDRFHHLRQFDPIRGRPCRTVDFDERGTIKARICAA